MSKFIVGDQIRHRTGVKLYLVLDTPTSGTYSLSGFGDGGRTLVLDCNVVDENYILYERRIHDEIITEDPKRVQQWQRDTVAIDMETAESISISLPRGMGKSLWLRQLAKSAKTQRFVEGYGGPVIPFKIDRAVELPADVAVTLEGIPQGYYLKAFRAAGPADLTIKTNGVICKEDCNYRGTKEPLLRPIVAKISEAKPRVPGIRDGFELVRVGTPQPGDLFVDAIGGVAECMKPSPTSFRPIVRKKVSLQQCNGILPGIPLGFTVVRFGDVSPEEFYFDTVGTLKQGPSKNRLVLKKVEPPISIPPWIKGPVFKGPVEWGVVDRKVRADAVNFFEQASASAEKELGAKVKDAFGHSGKAATRNDAADAAAYAVSQLRSACDTIKAEDAKNVQVEKEYKLTGARLTLWTAEIVSPILFGVMTPTGRSRKVKVI